jgi:hydrogenase nickel incorporation protein HypA/HybF
VRRAKGICVHEYSIAQSLLNRVDESLVGYRVVAITRLHVRIGELSGVDGGLLHTAYQLCRVGTSCERADLDVTTVPARWSCSICSRDAARGERLVCPACGGGVRLTAGDEILLERIEAEVDDV